MTRAPLPLSRRAALRAGGGALAAALVAPALAKGAAIDEGGLMLGLWRREMAAALAYNAVAHLDPLFVTLRQHEADHAGALATELSAVGLGTPEPPLTPDELDASAQWLAGSDARTAVANARRLEEDLVALYRNAVPVLPDPKITMTVATILASHSQHLLILRREADAG